MIKCERILHPKSTFELLDILSRQPQNYAILAGGTDIFVSERYRQNLRFCKNFLCVDRIKELGEISVDGNVISIGAATTFDTIISNQIINQHAPLLSKAATFVAGPQIRNIATIGGNVANASPAADGLTALVCLGAKAEICSMTNDTVNSRIARIEELIVGPGRIDCENNEIITRFMINSFEDSVHIYEKIGLRNAMAIAVVSVAFIVSHCKSPPNIRVALGSMGPKTVVSHEADEMVERGDVDGALEVYMKAVAPISDIRASSEFRKLTAHNILTRHLTSFARNGE